MADWLISNKDLLTVLVALAGILLALITALTNRNPRRRDALYRIHDLLTSNDEQEGRRLLYKAAADGVYPDMSDPEFATMNRAMATLNAVGLYVRRGIVPVRWVLETWHHAFADIKPAVEAFIAYRRSLQVNTGWRVAVDLDDLLDRAVRFRSRRACCAEVTLVPKVIAPNEPDASTA
jgi:hypothetical protein